VRACDAGCRDSYWAARRRRRLQWGPLRWPCGLRRPRRRVQQAPCRRVRARGRRRRRRSARRCTDPNEEARRAEDHRDEECRLPRRRVPRAEKWCKRRQSPCSCGWRTSRRFWSRRIRQRIGRGWRVRPSRSCRGRVFRSLACQGGYASGWRDASGMPRSLLPSAFPSIRVNRRSFRLGFGRRRGSW
jgi:hypothetical protein